MRLQQLVSRRGAHGMTLIELIVAVAIAALLMAAAAPLLTDWTASAQTGEARAKLAAGYAAAKALALRNPGAVALTDSAGSALPAAGLKLVGGSSNHTLYVCSGDPGATTCAAGGSSVTWQADYPATVATVLAGTAVASGSVVTLALDNRGQPTGATTYSLRRGGSAHDETGTLY